MLTLTENASAAIKSLSASIPGEAGGLRITESPEEGYTLTLAPEPLSTDAVVENDGARVFVDEVAAVTLDDRVLDARVDENGGVGFALASQAA